MTGITTLLALGILESIQEQGLVGNLLEMEHNSPEYLHTLVEALRFASPKLHKSFLIPSEGSPLQVILSPYTWWLLSNLRGPRQSTLRRRSRVRIRPSEGTPD